MIYTIEISQGENKKEYVIETSKPLLFMGDVSDEIVIINGKAKLFRRLGVSKYGKTYRLAVASEENLIRGKDTKIELFEGDNQIRIIGSYGKSYIKYMLKNDYSEMFATKIEVKSEIKQTADSINLEVSKKVGNNEIISRINQTAEAIVISANKISLAGKIINLTSDNIAINSNNFRVDQQGNMWARNGTFSGNITGSTISSGKIDVGANGGYLRVGVGYTNPEVSGINVTGNNGINIKGLGINNTGGEFHISGGVKSPYIKATNEMICNGKLSVLGADGVRCNKYGAANKVLITSTYNNIELEARNGVIYAWGNGKPNGRVLTDEGQSSSKNIKKNIKKFKKENYENALNLLDKINIYNYQYKYAPYDVDNQFGFLIDEIEEQDKNNFFKFETVKAVVNDNNIDYIYNPDKKGKVIEVKKYDPNILDKYLLTCVKALQQEIEVLKNEIKTLKGGKNGD